VNKNGTQERISLARYRNFRKDLFNIGKQGLFSLSEM
jgi:hypothetical protein